MVSIVYGLCAMTALLSAVLLGLALPSNEESGVVYMLRVVSYGLILAAILDKNLPRKKEKERAR